MKSLIILLSLNLWASNKDFLPQGLLGGSEFIAGTAMMKMDIRDEKLFKMDVLNRKEAIDEIMREIDRLEKIPNSREDIKILKVELQKRAISLLEDIHAYTSLYGELKRQLSLKAGLATVFYLDLIVRVYLLSEDRDPGLFPLSKLFESH